MYFDTSFCEIHPEYAQNTMKYHFYSIQKVLNELKPILSHLPFMCVNCAMNMNAYTSICAYFQWIPVGDFLILLDIQR